jgi:predicted RNA-binding Zn ribbon-like protein
MDPLFLEFINSNWYVYHDLFLDPLIDQKWVDAFCAKWNLPTIDISVESNSKTLLDLRAFMRKTIKIFLETKKISSENLKRLNRYLRMGKTHPELHVDDGTYCLEIVPARMGINWIVYRVVLSFADFLQNHADRIKMCQNPDCGWVFYDQSKGDNRKWCDNKCASLMKVRKFRAAKKQSDEIESQNGENNNEHNLS